MSGKWWIAALAALKGASLALAACGGGGTKGSGTPDGSATAADAKPTPSATAVVNGNQWTITLTAPAGQYDKYEPAFDGFLSAFKLT